MNPLVTCLCLTHNRREWLPAAITYYLRQTYQPRELLVVATGDEPVRDLVPRDDPAITLLNIGWTVKVGEKRNLGCEAARGGIIAVWDDDDYSAPQRLEFQLSRLETTQKTVTGFRVMKFTDGRRWWRYTGHSGFVLGTSLCFRREWWRKYPFAGMQVGQDEMFGAEAQRAQQLAVEGDHDLMYATVHPGNTSPRVISGPAWAELPGFVWPELELAGVLREP